jgi:hypothetical protein
VAQHFTNMPKATEADAVSRCVIERNPGRSRFQLTNRIKRSRCAGPFHDQPFNDYYLDHRGNKTISTDSIYLSSYASNGALLSEQEIKGNDELLYLMERHNITAIELRAGL